MRMMWVGGFEGNPDSPEYGEIVVRIKSYGHF